MFAIFPSIAINLCRLNEERSRLRRVVIEPGALDTLLLMGQFAGPSASRRGREGSAARAEPFERFA
tara:strand:+ start:7395 stop:7592 length:198 start_codon:yes stop_codon:yes gene_type:complete